jgi:hypothetical protein
MLAAQVPFSKVEGLQDQKLHEQPVAAAVVHIMS